MDNLEIEVKFFIPDPEQMRQRLMALGTDHKRRVFETNLRFEDENESLRKKKALLRLRRDSRNILTFKCVSGQDMPECKVSQEIETTVSDFAATAAIFEALGYHRAQVYEKWRETFRLGEALICLDTMPFGDFMEIEGATAEIKAVAGSLGLNWGNRILKTYLGLFAALRDIQGLTFSDITFDNFKAAPPVAQGFWSRFEAGRGV